MTFVYIKLKSQNSYALKVVKIKNLIKRKYSDCKAADGKKTTEFVTLDNMNQNLIKMDYAVRGPLLIRANEIEKELASGQKKPFTSVIKANLGDSQAMGQKPITFFRQVLSLVTYPELLSNKSFPPDVVSRAKELLSVCRGGSVGSYSESFGIDLIRKHAAEFITKRDGFESKWENIMLSAGASEAIKNVLKLLNQEIRGKPPGVMIPIPQYPLYSATLSEFGMSLIGYYLNESKNWSLDIQELERSYSDAQKTCTPRAIAVINPGNPTGQVLTKENIQEIVKFAYENKLVILADEVYQSNVYGENSEFHSIKKVINELGPPYDGIELASFMSCSKGYMGECGLRGAYCELVNFNSDVRANFSKCISSMLCPTVTGQCLLDCVVKPPAPGEPSYDLYASEKNHILGSLKAKGKMVHGFFNSIKGFSCNEVQGAMYAFPRIEIPEKAVEAAKAKNMTPDTFYAFALLENTGICVIPGSGFKQQPGTFHFRTTILPPIDLLREMLETFRKFHQKFLEEYGKGNQL